MTSYADLVKFLREKHPAIQQSALDIEGAPPHYRGTSLVENAPSLDPTIGPCLGSQGVPGGVGVFYADLVKFLREEHPAIQQSALDIEGTGVPRP